MSSAAFYRPGFATSDDVLDQPQSRRYGDIPPGRTPWSLSLLANLASEILNLIMVATPSSSRFAQASAHVNSGRLPRGGPAS